MLFNDFPIEIKEKILIFLLPNIQWDINKFKNYFLVCKEWKYILNTYNFREQLSKDLGVYYYYKNQFSNKKLLDKLFIYKNLIRYGNTKYIKYFYDNDIVDIFSTNGLLKIPVCEFRCSACLDSMCKNECYENDHYLETYIDSNIMRGVDDKNRPYILFVYKDLITDEIYYEFIYTVTIQNNKYSTFSGYYNCTFIGMNSYIYEGSHMFYRILDDNCFEYIERLLNNEKCTIPEYCVKNNKFIEGKKGNITIYF